MKLGRAPSGLLGILVGAVALAAAFGGPAAGSAVTAGQVPSRSVWSGVYTAAQARRGHFAYLAECARCHAENLMGGDDAVPLAGEAFLSNWDGRTAGDLFDKIRLSMPDDNPGSLSKESAADVLAYLLNENGFPAGGQELAHETALLKQIRIEAKQP